MVKVTLLGAGSQFAQPLFTDIFQIEGLDEGVAALVDIDGKRLDLSARVIQRVNDLLGKQWRVEASTDRRKVLKGTDYLISTIEVSGLKCVRYDNDIPLKYGIDQCIGDTIGPGGIMKALRTLPPFLEILEDAQRLCPNALVMNYTNPMSIITLAATRSSSQPFVGLCHSVQGTSKALARYLGVPYEELLWNCGGINHMAWFTTLQHKGRDMYPALRKAMAKPEIYEHDPVRFELMREFGYFVTESSGHLSEYMPYFRKRKDLLKKYMRERYKGESGFYKNSWPVWRKSRDKNFAEMLSGKREIKLGRSHEFASDIIAAHQFDRLTTIYASVPNTGLIPNLPLNGVVEVPTLVSRRGFQPTYFGPLPEQVAALCRSNMAVYEMAVQGILNKDREALINAFQLDPLSGAVCSLAEIRQMAEELFRAEREFIPKWVAKKG